MYGTESGLLPPFYAEYDSQNFLVLYFYSQVFFYLLFPPMINRTVGLLEYLYILLTFQK